MQAIKIPCIQIGLTVLVYYMPVYIQYNIFPCNTPNKIIGSGLVVQYPTWDTYKNNNNSEQQHEAIKYDFDTMVEVDNQTKKQIYIMVDDKYLKGG